MDPVTQGVVGATAAQLVSTRKQKLTAAAIGFLSGMAADLDVLIHSSEDPLLFLEYHRHFTHALVFIPIGALLCTIVFGLIFKSWFQRNKLTFKQTYLFSFAGYATHALLDACTTYGTQLFWPFSDARVAWNNVSVVDPLFTLPLLALLVIAIVKRSNKAAYLSSLYALGYLSVGVLQNHRAEDHAHLLAQSRGHTPINLGVKPSMANLIVWKSVYEYQGRYYIDAIRVGSKTKVYSGTSVAKLDLLAHFDWLKEGSQQALDVERFRWFSNRHLGIDPMNADRIIDVRYSLIPNEVTGMWGIELSKTKSDSEHVNWVNNRPKGKKAIPKAKQLWLMILGR